MSLRPSRHDRVRTKKIELSFWAPSQSLKRPADRKMPAFQQNPMRCPTKTAPKQPSAGP